MKVTLQPGEQVEDLQCKDLKIIQNKDLYNFTSDSVILANFITLNKEDNCVEIGAGSGVISILLSAKQPFKKITAFELQAKMAALAEKNVILNDLTDKIKVINDDVKNYRDYITPESVNVVFSNPPYMKSGANVGENDIRAAARHDKYLLMDDLCNYAYSMLKFGGKFYIVYSAERAAELIHCLIEHKLEPKRMFFTENGKGKVVLVVIEAVKGGKHGVKVLPNLVTNEKTGEYLKTLQTKYFAKN